MKRNIYVSYQAVAEWFHNFITTKGMNPCEWFSTMQSIWKESEKKILG